VPDWLLDQTFYNGLEQSVKISVDAIAGGALMGKSIEVAKTLLEEMASNNYHWSSERAAQKKSSGRYEVDAVTLLTSQVDALAQRLDRVGAPNPVGVHAICETCGVLGHTSINCYNGPSTIEHANAMHNFNPTPQGNSYPNAHSLGWKNYSNSLYRNPNPQPQNVVQSPGFQYRAAYNPPPLPLQPKSNLDSLMEQFIATQTKNNEGLSSSIN